MPALYVHIPFCARKCGYCDFYSVEDLGGVAAFLEALDREAVLAGGPSPIETVFLGGGTPSLLSPGQVDRILGSLRRRFRLLPGAEITLEANPGTVTRDSLQDYRHAGINRLSLGIQSFADPALRRLGRIHDARAAHQAIHDARAAGFDNLSLDLIYALPDQTLDAWEDDLGAALAHAPEHVSAYALTIERHTPLGRQVAAGAVRSAGSDLEAAMFERAMDRLEAHGYEHYEVSSYARPKYRCRHNLNYWWHGDYLGLGPAAHSFARREARRWWNLRDLDAYTGQLLGGRLPVAGEERLGPEELLAERLFLALRAGGLDLAALRREFGRDLAAERQDVIEGLVQARKLSREGETLRLTRAGYLVCDEIAERLMPD